ncbi:adenylosuccinate synthetase [Photobacterium iliopiscarium]|jgi:adenylosuccinate synthase|uniref:Adenylosuccinate synthetase n=1 Tax=Photobacterium iliopiscarium TaxID=56192 RepID=A0A0D8PR44_9GAMM|nr:adenylosuccinate synthase [Photobacterium iliopiscarium]KJG14589.1 adenylosuccinate synthetase [Photobacterium iliopiscarium]KJG21083.1 adenylosuccinate synthetase [Photobacterium iliopiscarium]PST95400.1 adenylosuccinate synthase [Photobacterium iliopiscarium]PSU00341.1 adenylosuccinate synthase [Photobacterium iliopiscarium]PSV84874.1 adenylosuccinate synthase [Photobacterium iliopiscarium]
MSSIVVVGANWGDEGKGRIVDFLADQASASIRFQGGNNAGHTVVNDFGTFKLHQLPSGVFNPDCIAVLGPGMVISPEKLSLEIEEVAASGVDVKLCISDRATLCLPLHALEDTLEEERLGAGAYGSTRQGIAPAYGDRVMKKGILVGWLNQPAVLLERIQFMMDWKLPQLKALYPSMEFTQTAEEMTEWLLEVSQPWRDSICNVTEPLKALQKEDKTLLFEAQLGAGRDLVYGEYPWTTSSNVTAAYAGIGSGLPALHPERVIAVAKSFSSSVGTGTLITAMEDQDQFREDAKEFGATTGRPRDMGYFDAVATRNGVELQAATEIALTKIDCLSGMKDLKICVAYNGDHTENPIWPQTASLTAVYEQMMGWDEDITGCRKFDELPEGAQQYVLRIEELMGVPVKMVSVGPEREQMILR